MTISTPNLFSCSFKALIDPAYSLVELHFKTGMEDIVIVLPQEVAEELMKRLEYLLVDKNEDPQ